MREDRLKTSIYLTERHTEWLRKRAARLRVKGFAEVIRRVLDEIIDAEEAVRQAEEKLRRSRRTRRPVKRTDAQVELGIDCT